LGQKSGESGFSDSRGWIATECPSNLKIVVQHEKPGRQMEKIVEPNQKMRVRGYDFQNCHFNLFF
jgi:hypothetical protein